MIIDNEKRKVELKEIKRLLINIDMVNGFVKKGDLASPSIQRILPENIARVREFLNTEESAVAFIRDAHTKSAVEFNTFAPHCLKGTLESELVDELRKYERFSLTYLKNSTNFVFAPGFINDITAMENLKEVVLNGCLTDFCVKNGGITLRDYFDQNDRDVKIYVEEVGVDTFDAPGHNREEVNEQSLKDMEANGIIRVKKYLCK